MSELYEYYNNAHTGSSGIYANLWKAMTFTPQTAHRITSVKLRLFRSGLPGTLTVGIRATNGEGKPIVPDLCLGTIDADDFTTDAWGLWYKITLGAGSNLSLGTKYAIVCRALGGSAAKYVGWRSLGTDPYPRGNQLDSSDSGDSWTPQANMDYQFEDWGVPPAAGYSQAVIID